MSNVAVAEALVSCLFDSQTGLFLSPSGRFDASPRDRSVYDDREFIPVAKRFYLARGITTVVEVAADVEEYRGCVIACPIINEKASRIFVAYIPLSVMGPSGRPTSMCFNIGPNVADVKKNLDFYRQQGWIKDHAN